MESFLKTSRGKILRAAVNILFFAIIGGLGGALSAAIITRSPEEMLTCGCIGISFGIIISLLDMIVPMIVNLKKIIGQKFIKGETDEQDD